MIAYYRNPDPTICRRGSICDPLDSREFGSERKARAWARAKLRCSRLASFRTDRGVVLYAPGDEDGETVEIVY